MHCVVIIVILKHYEYNGVRYCLSNSTPQTQSKHYRVRKHVLKLYSTVCELRDYRGKATDNALLLMGLELIVL